MKRPHAVPSGVTTTFDAVVLGTGVAASTAAALLADADWRVAIVDERPFGGTCALRGCDPKKVLVSAAEAVDHARRMHEHGVIGHARIDWPELMRFKRSFTEPVPVTREESYESAGMTTLHGTARFTGPRTLIVGEREVETRCTLIATGARPRPLNVPGEEHVVTSTVFLDLDALPERIVFIGGGYVSFEFAHVAARAGAKPVILHRSERPLGAFDPDLVDRLVQASRDAGVDVRLNEDVARVERDGDAFVVHSKSGARVTSDLVVHGAGRVPDVDRLGLDAANVAHSRKGVTVNAHLQSTTNPHVYAAGDAADTAGWPLTPVAIHEGEVAGTNMRDGNTRTPDYEGTVSVAFTLPPLARVGLTEDEAREKGLRYRVTDGDMREWYNARRVNERCAAFKVLIEEDTDRVLGAHLLGRDAPDVINLFALAIRHDLTTRDLERAPFAYPTRSWDVRYML